MLGVERCSAYQVYSFDKFSEIFFTVIMSLVRTPPRCIFLVQFILLISKETTSERQNILFLVADDMRPEMGCYFGKDFPVPVYPRMISPNLDYLASRSLLLKRAYVQEAVCSPSRTSLLTGRRPDTTKVWEIGPYFRKVGGNFTTLPQYFKENDYVSVGMTPFPGLSHITMLQIWISGM